MPYCPAVAARAVNVSPSSQLSPMTPREEGLPRRQRVLKRGDFVRGYETGTKIFGRHVVLFVMPNELGHPRIGVTATRKLGKAHDRNRVKRWVREVFRRNQASLGLITISSDLLVNVKPAARATTFDDFSKDLLAVFRKYTGSRR